MSDKYILAADGRTPLPVDDVLEWGRWFAANRETRRVAHTVLIPQRLIVSTVFLGLDHSFSFGGDGPPILFETMVFECDEAGEFVKVEPYGGIRDLEMDRYATWDEAEAGHAAMVARAAAGDIPLPPSDDTPLCACATLPCACSTLKTTSDS